MVHTAKRHVVWPIVLWLAAGSIPSSIATNFAIAHFDGGSALKGVLTLALGVMLTITGVSIVFRKHIETFFQRHRSAPLTEESMLLIPPAKLVSMGVVLGVLVTLSSVGAGAFGMMALVLMFPYLPMIRLIGSDVMHAVLLTLVAGLGHLLSGGVDLPLLGWLLVGSIPSIIVGTLVASKLPEAKIRPILGVTLILIGVNFVLGGPH